MGERETPIVVAIRIALGTHTDCVFFRNQRGAIRRSSAKHIPVGLFPGASDLIGCVRGRWCCLEVKTSKGRVKEEQRMFLELVRSKGGFGCVVRSVDDALAAVERCRKGAFE